MGKYQEEKKTPIIMVKKRRTLLPPSLSEKTGVIARSETEKMEESVSEGISSPAVDTHTPDAPALLSCCLVVLLSCCLVVLLSCCLVVLLSCCLQCILG